MSIVINSLLHALREATARSTDQFERAKSSISRTLLRPAIILLGSEAVIVSILGAVKLFKLQIGLNVFELVGAGSENMLLLTAMVVTTYISTLVANIYSRRLADQSVERLAKIAHEINKGENFNSLVDQYKTYIALNKPDEARAIATWIIHRYPDEAERDPFLVKTIASDMSILHIIPTDDARPLPTPDRKLPPPR